MRNKLYLAIASLLISARAFAQIPDGSTAPDFTFADINGTPQSLYTYLNQGKYVAIDVSATWCLPCWNYHQGKVMDSLYNAHDTPGDNTWKVLFMETDGSTDSADLYGATTSSQGNWVQGTDYTIIDPPTGVALSDFQNLYELSYFPTFLLICPNKKVFQYTLNGPRPTVAIWESVASSSCFPAGIDNIQDENPVTVYPNPAVGSTTIYFSLNEVAAISLTVTNSIGQRVDDVSYGSLYPGDQSLNYDVSKLPPGLYVFSIICDNQRVIKKKVTVQ